MVSPAPLPYSLVGVLRATWTYGLFLLLSLVCQVVGLAIFLVTWPALLFVRRFTLRPIFGFLVCHVMRLYLALCRWVIDIPSPRELERMAPSVVVANHQSFLDILSLVASSARLVFVVKGWVARSPVFGGLARALGFYCVEGGSSAEMIERLGHLVSQGCSVAIFPEGTRSADCRIHRFHMGAVALADQLNLPLTPVVYYGNGRLVPKNRPFSLFRGTLSCHVLPTLSVSDLVGQSPTSNPEQPIERMLLATKRLRTIMTDHFDAMCQALDAPNPYFAEALQRGFLTCPLATRLSLKPLVHRYAQANIGQPLPQVTPDAPDAVCLSPYALGAIWLALRGRVRNVVALLPKAHATVVRQSAHVAHAAQLGVNLILLELNENTRQSASETLQICNIPPETLAQIEQLSQTPSPTAPILEALQNIEGIEPIFAALG